MGASSRPDNYDASKFTPEQSIDYFVNYLENWRKEMNLTDFYLAGHSFGGYLVGNYASVYP
jgi:pimeloyl-ACP methyl ester carboxylesterase